MVLVAVVNWVFYAKDNYNGPSVTLLVGITDLESP